MAKTKHIFCKIPSLQGELLIFKSDFIKKNFENIFWVEAAILDLWVRIMKKWSNILWHTPFKEWEVPIPGEEMTRSDLARLAERHKIFNAMKRLQLTKVFVSQDIQRYSMKRFQLTKVFVSQDI